MENCEQNIKYLKLLAKQYPTIADASTEIINLEAILNLPKGTEHFLADLHGEYEPFVHVLKNGSGAVKIKIEEVFGNSLMASEKKSLATLVYYPEQKLEIVLKEEKDINDWYKINLYRLIELCRHVSSKYTRSKVRKALPKDFSYIIEELLHEECDSTDKQGYYDGIINTIIEIERAKEFIIALSNLIQRLVIDRLHIIGDIYDRGPRPDIIIDTLIDYHSVDIQWGNHDILWMGAASGNKTCIANVLRIAARYSNLDVIEDIYGINLLPLATFALKYYKDDKCTSFIPKHTDENGYGNSEIELIAKMHKAITIIQFKLEYEIIKRRPEFKMEHRLLLDKIDYSAGTITLNGITYELNDTNFPTINKDKPFELTSEEKKLIDKIQVSFLNSDKLQKHILFLFTKGRIYLTYNSNLLFHGCIPLNNDKSFKSLVLNGKDYKGKKLLGKFDSLAREGYFNKRGSSEKLYGMDVMWYLWTGACSSLFGKEDMATFERYFIKDKSTHKEKKNPYYDFRDSEEMCNMIFEEFNLNPSESRIINGHVPVKDKFGESPIKCNGKLIVIDGGFAKAYRKETGLAGYTLTYNSYGLQLISHQPFKSIEDAFTNEIDILSSRRIVEKLDRKKVGDTDVGQELKTQIRDLKLLLNAYRKGLINETR
ncbi:fructose-bisphosphatase class III [Clostridium saccharobutylicum]|uniref:Fructose-1,6-bisphosphatase class 3 n=3 Tax=Clostridium saccharobutylicum TaxID=169679 RepID=U5MLN3_CLOSA|nr:fructose-bisphosphatase class III [Clostridium saccharobutylicum]AGX41719.1 fructose-1,6-bisphosphatase class 3 2 [Clostridium saccharobutylicum DSM 13864]AQR88999.1 fructose-1,6-bisphosphatase class 3 [Clostridium saccharobutylicum]AQR98900.1 fructose-1,6-bisphosphatase class 3 [Clostridium saccharobutylicum]AQS08619.1 fructose-1,6-bisphosphatase class 3 [Clostridium saccharobutylicum]AQS12888.1 fructose-1,6-bisphosphatase class 3 [Clostridium saccharobutylicum]